MDHFIYRDGLLHAEGVPLDAIARDIGTPTYVYAAATLTDHTRKLQHAFAALDPMICFAVKACPNIHILSLLAEFGLGMDVVSGGELHRASRAGVPPERIVFAGVGKSDEEIRAALTGAARPIAMFNIESEPEYHAIADAAAALNVKARAALRVIPEVHAGGHAAIRTGHADSKFGITLADAHRLIAQHHNHPHLPLTGLHLHIGSSILSPAPYAAAIARVLALADDLARDGVTIDTLDLGGGFGADYHDGNTPAPPAHAFAEAIVPMLLPRVRRGLRVILEPGRTIAANAGVLLTRVRYVKQSAGKTFVITDAGMNTLLRPALYDAFHFIWPVRVEPRHIPSARDRAHELPGLTRVDVVGPLCETGDFLAHDRRMPPVKRGDLIAIFAAGAYGMSMTSRYNTQPLPAEVLVKGPSFKVIRRRETLDDLTAHE